LAIVQELKAIKVVRERLETRVSLASMESMEPRAARELPGSMVSMV
jgi:hypothetical protein